MTGEDMRANRAIQARARASRGGDAAAGADRFREVAGHARRLLRVEGGDGHARRRAGSSSGSARRRGSPIPARPCGPPSPPPRGPGSSTFIPDRPEDGSRARRGRRRAPCGGRRRRRRRAPAGPRTAGIGPEPRHQVLQQVADPSRARRPGGPAPAPPSPRPRRGPRPGGRGRATSRPSARRPTAGARASHDGAGGGARHRPRVVVLDDEAPRVAVEDASGARGRGRRRGRRRWGSGRGG